MPANQVTMNIRWSAFDPEHYRPLQLPCTIERRTFNFWWKK